MRTSLGSTILVFGLVGVLAAQSPVAQDPTRYPVSGSDRNRKIVESEIARITQGNPASHIGNKLNQPVVKVEGKAIQKLFPNYDFYFFSFHNEMKKGFEAESQNTNLAGGLGEALAVRRDDGRLTRLHLTGNHESYGDLLQQAGAAIHNAGDARLVWDAFCELLFAPKERELQQVSQNEWKLGIYSYDQTLAEDHGVKTVAKRTYYCRVFTDPSTHRVLSFKSAVDQFPGRREANR